MAKTAKKVEEVEEVIVSLTHREAYELVEDFLSVGDELSIPEGGGEYDEETIELIRSAVCEILHNNGVEVY